MPGAPARPTATASKMRLPRPESVCSSQPRCPCSSSCTATPVCSSTVRESGRTKPLMPGVPTCHSSMGSVHNRSSSRMRGFQRMAAPARPATSTYFTNERLRAVTNWAPWSKAKLPCRRVPSLPPRPRERSNTVTSASARDSSSAQASPAMPAPMTAMLTFPIVLRDVTRDRSPAGRTTGVPEVRRVAQRGPKPDRLECGRHHFSPGMNRHEPNGRVPAARSPRERGRPLHVRHPRRPQHRDLRRACEVAGHHAGARHARRWRGVHGGCGEPLRHESRHAGDRAGGGRDPRGERHRRGVSRRHPDAGHRGWYPPRHRTTLPAARRGPARAAEADHQGHLAGRAPRGRDPDDLRGGAGCHERRTGPGVRRDPGQPAAADG